MQKVAQEHFFTVRGRGFTGREWEEILKLAREIVERGVKVGIPSTFTGDARRIEVAPEKGEPLVVWCKGEPGIPRTVKTEGRFDVVVQSILTAIKKVAPDIFVMSATDGRDYRRILAGKDQDENQKTKTKEATMNDEIIRRAAIRVAHSTKDQGLKRQLLEILRDTTPKAAASKEKEGRHEEGSSVDVGTWLKEHGYEEAAAKWEMHEGEIGKKSSSAVVFPTVRELAWKSTIEYAHAHPRSKTAAVSTAIRVTAADRLAEKWIQDAIKRPGRVHKYLGIPESEDIPAAKLDEAIEKVKDTGNKSLLSALLLAKRLKGMAKKKAA